MLYWKYSSKRIFFLNEYWILVPTMLVADYLIIRNIRSHKKKMEELRKLKEIIERYKKQQKLRRVAYLACGLSLSSIWMVRGGEDFIDVDYIDCGIEEGLRYLDNDRIRKIIHDLYASKRKGRIIYITSTAACHLVKIYGKHFLSLPFTVKDFGVTNLYQTIRKLTVTILMGAVGPLYVAGGRAAIFTAFTLVTLALRLAYTDLDRLPTSPIDETIPARQIEPRIADLPDVVTVNCRNKVKAPSIVPEKGECWLAEQAYFNPNCKVKTTEILPAGLGYDEVVNMKDVTGLEHVDFSDILDLGQNKPSISKSSKGKMVKFLDIFGDPADIGKSETWDASSITDTVPKKMNLRTGN